MFVLRPDYVHARFSLRQMCVHYVHITRLVTRAPRHLRCNYVLTMIKTFALRPHHALTTLSPRLCGPYLIRRHTQRFGIHQVDICQ